MFCQEHEEHLNLFLDGELKTAQTGARRAAEQVELFKHLSECGACRGFLDTMMRFRKAVALEQNSPFPADVDQGVFEELLRRKGAYARNSRREARSSFWTRQISLPVATAAVLLLCLLTGAVGWFWLGHHSARPDGPRVSSRATGVPVKVLVIYTMPEVVVPAEPANHREGNPIPVRIDQGGPSHAPEDQPHHSGFASVWSALL